MSVCFKIIIPLIFFYLKHSVWVDLAYFDKQCPLLSFVTAMNLSAYIFFAG